MFNLAKFSTTLSEIKFCLKIWNFARPKLKLIQLEIIELLISLSQFWLLKMNSGKSHPKTDLVEYSGNFSKYCQN